MLSISISSVSCGSDDSDPVVVLEDPKPDPSNASTTIEATSPVVADGTATSAVTVTLADTKGNRFTSSGGTVALVSTGTASISSVTDNSDGSYGATVTNTTAETVTISGTLGGTAITDTADITFDAVSAPDPDPAGSTIEATSPVVADGTSTSTVTVTLVDTDGNPYTASGGAMALVSTGDAIISIVTDNTDGTYTATVTNTKAETVTITGTLSDVAITDTAEIIFDPLPPVDSLVIAINAGGEQVLIDAVTFVKDTLFTLPSTPFSNDMINDILATEADTLYVTERIRGIGVDLGTIGYSIPVDNATYEVKLHFAELYWGLEGQGGAAGGVGSRIFDVMVEDSLVIDDYDIFADVGAATATIKTHETMVVDGTLNIVLTASVDQPKISAIEVIKKAGN